jgi:hypothetical protein
LSIHYKPRSFLLDFLSAPISKAAIIGVAVGGLVILLMILVAVCRPHHPPAFKDATVSKPGNAFTNFGISYNDIIVHHHI